jgi:hypothetical protein
MSIDVNAKSVIAIITFTLVLVFAFVSSSSVAMQGSLPLTSSTSSCLMTIVCMAAFAGIFFVMYEEEDKPEWLPEWIPQIWGTPAPAPRRDDRIAFGRLAPTTGPPPKWSEFLKVPHTVIVGKVLDEFDGLSQEECGKKCHENPKCALVHTMDNYKKCILKSSEVPKECVPWSNPDKLCMDHKNSSVNTYVYPDNTIIQNGEKLKDYTHKNLLHVRDVNNSLHNSITKFREYDAAVQEATKPRQRSEEEEEGVSPTRKTFGGIPIPSYPKLHPNLKNMGKVDLMWDIATVLLPELVMSLPLGIGMAVWKSILAELAIVGVDLGIHTAKAFSDIPKDKRQHLEQITQHYKDAAQYLTMSTKIERPAGQRYDNSTLAYRTLENLNMACSAEELKLNNLLNDPTQKSQFMSRCKDLWTKIRNINSKHFIDVMRFGGIACGADTTRYGYMEPECSKKPEYVVPRNIVGQQAGQPHYRYQYDNCDCLQLVSPFREKWFSKSGSRNNGEGLAIRDMSYLYSKIYDGKRNSRQYAIPEYADYNIKNKENERMKVRVGVSASNVQKDIDKLNVMDEMYSAYK